METDARLLVLRHHTVVETNTLTFGAIRIISKYFLVQNLSMICGVVEYAYARNPRREGFADWLAPTLLTMYHSLPTDA